MDACWDYLDVFFFPSILLFILTEEVIRMFLSIRKQKKKIKVKTTIFPSLGTSMYACAAVTTAGFCWCLPRKTWSKVSPINCFTVPSDPVFFVLVFYPDCFCSAVSKLTEAMQWGSKWLWGYGNSGEVQKKKEYIQLKTIWSNVLL